MLIKNSYLERQTSIFIAFIFLFSPRLSILPFNLTPILLVVLSSIFLFFTPRKIPNSLTVFLVLSVPGFLLTLVTQLIHNPFTVLISHSFVVYYLSGILTFFSVLTLFILYKNRLLRNPFFIIESIIYAAFLNSSIAFLSVVSVGFRNYLYTVIDLSAKSEKFTDANRAIFLRFSGLSYSGFSSYSVLILTVAIVSYFLGFSRSSTRYSFNNRIKFLFIAIFLAIMTLFSGRSSMLVFVIFILSTFLILISSAAVNLRLKILSKSRFNTIVLLGFAIASIVALQIFVGNIELVDRAYYFEMFLNLENINSMPTFQAIKDMWFLPSGHLGELLFGTGNFGLSLSEKLNTDIGWVYIIHGIGLFGVILILLPLFFIGKEFIVKTNFPSFGLYIVFSFLLLNFKDLYFIGPGGLTFLIFSFFLSLCLASNSPSSSNILPSNSSKIS